MAVSDEFVDYVVEQLADWGEVSVRRMFGGAGLYRQGVMFAVVADDVAYLKVDDSNREDFLRAGSAPFEPYPDKIKTTIRTYYEIPADVLEDPEELAGWAQRSWLVAREQAKRGVIGTRRKMAVARRLPGDGPAPEADGRFERKMNE